MNDLLSIKNHTGREKIVYTGIPSANGDFCVELAGITYSDRQYCIRHNPSSLYVFEYVQDGEGVIVYDGLKLTVKAGDFYLIPCKTACVYYANPNNPYQKIWFNACGTVIGKLLEAYKLDMPAILAHVNVESRIYHLHDLLKQKLSDHNSASYAEMMMQFELGVHELIAFISRCHINAVTPAKSLAQQIREFLDINLTNRMSINDLSKTFFISRSYLIRCFQKEYHQSPYDYFLMQKIRVACSLLCQTTLPIQEIAARLFFLDAHYFSNVFKKKIGCSPSQYRNSSIKRN